MTSFQYTRHISVEEKKNKLVKDLTGLVTNADDLLRDVANSTVEEFTAAREKIEQRLRAARTSLDHARIAATRKACDAADASQAYARENPWKVVGIPAVIAFVVLALLSRR